MGNIWIATDLHLYSRDNDPRHPFRSRHNIGVLSDQFAQDIQEDDLLIFLGDLCDPDVTDEKKLAAIVQRIPCRKLMCRGNHDLQDDEFYKRIGFDEVTEIITLYNIVFSHKPVKVAADEINIHGHLHTEKLVTMGWNHINAYAANWNKDDHPVLLEDLLKSAVVQEHEYSDKERAHVTEKFEKYTTLENEHYTKILDISDEFPLCPVDETVDIQPNSELAKIAAFCKWIDQNFHYGLRINGRWDPKRNTSAEDWDKYLKVQSPTEIEKSKVGVCWDYVSYEAWYFQKNFPGIKYKTYYMQFFNDEDCPSHTILTFTIGNKHYYFENSFRKLAGIYEAKSEEDIINFVLKMMSDNPDPSIPKGELLRKWRYDAWEYDALDSALFGMGCEEYMNHVMGTGRCLYHEYKAVKPLQKLNWDVVHESADILDEVLFKDVDDTKYWLKDDKEYREQVEKGEESDKSVAAIDESWVMVQNDLQINLDKWAPGNPLWVTGASGDGKSTLAHKIAKEHNATIITMDVVLCRMGWTKEKFEKALSGEIVTQAATHLMDFSSSPAVDYVLQHPELPYEAKDPKTHTFKAEITDPEMLKFCNWLMTELSTNPKYRNKLYVVEGCDICLMDPAVMITKPLIIVGGSRMRSLIRRARRDSTEKNQAYLKSVFKYITKYNLQAKRLDDNKDTFRQGIQSLIGEAVAKRQIKTRKSEVVFLSPDSDWDEAIIDPRIPDNYMTQNGYEDNTTPRVCFSTSISKALRAMSKNIKGMEFYVYVPYSDSYKIVTPTKEQVPDVELTGERWILEPVGLYMVGKITVLGPTRGVGLKYKYGDGKTAELYDWSWKWEYKDGEDKCDGTILTVNEGTEVVKPVINMDDLSRNVARIKKCSEDDKSGGKAGNQNCLFCTWAVELSMRGDRISPRPVYSPRDIIFTLNGYDIVKNALPMTFKNRYDAERIAREAGDGSRFYVHVNWNGSTGGHEFNLMNLNGKVCVVDGQAGLITDIDSKEAKSYFDVNFLNSYMVRTDNKAINRDMLKYNNSKYITPWDEELDIAFMKDQGMITEEAIQFVLNEMAYEDAADFLYGKLKRLCREFNKKDEFFREIAKKWKKENPEFGDPVKLNVKMLSSGDNQLCFSLVDDMDTDHYSVGQVASYWHLVKKLTDTLEKDKEVKDFVYIKRFSAQAEDFVGLYVDLAGINALDINDERLYWPKVTAKTTPTENPNDWKSKKAVSVEFYNDKGKVVGTACVSGIDTDERYLYDFEVKPAYRGKKYGNAIMAWLMKQYNIAELCVETDNEPAIHLYEKNGFKKDGTFEDYHTTMLVMRTKPKHGKGKVNEDAAETHSVNREEKADIAKKYGLQAVGDTHESEEAEEKERKKKEAEKAKAAKEKELQRKREARNKALAKGRRTQKRNRFIKKVKSHLPGVKNEEADAIDNTDAAYIDDYMVEHDARRGDRIRVNADLQNYQDAALDESHTYQFEMLDHVQFFDRVNESSTDDKKPAPVFVVLIKGNSPVSAMIQGFTHSEFTHASISFDSSLTKMYSFAAKDVPNKIEALIGGFKLENIQSEFYKKNKIPYAVYLVPSTKGAIKNMKKRLDYFIQNATKFRFDYLGLVKNFFKIPDNPENTWFCSRFVADILNAGSMDKKLIDTPSLYRPEDFKSAGFAQCVDSGLAANYNKKIVDQKTKMILRAQKLTEGVVDVLPDNPWAHQVLNYQLTLIDESAVDDFVSYMQSFKLRFDKDGNIVVTRREYDQLEMHFRSSLKMIKACESAGNIDGVKEELYKIHYMIELINQYYLRPDVKNLKPNAKDVRKDMLDLRSVMMNAFQQHLKYVSTRDTRWNFQAGYDQSKYGKEITIPQKVITAIGKTIITALK